MTVWNILTGHYPPQPGGVSDYTRLVAHGLAAAGDEVTVWTSPFNQDSSKADGVRVNRLPDHFGPRGLTILNRELRRGRGSRVLLEYVPQAFGMKAMNIPLCLLLLRHRHRDITVMFHEVAYPIDRRQPLRHNLLGTVNRAMAATLARSASRIFVAAQAWRAEVARYVPAGREIKWLPVPSTIGIADKCATFRKRKSSAAREIALGHFGTYGSLVAERLKPALQKILVARADTKVVLIGRNSEQFLGSFIELNPQLAQRITATGALDAAHVSAVVSACDLMVQPYPDGITSRNTSALTGLEHGRPLVTTAGRFTEDLWAKSGAVALAPDNDADALARCVFELADDRVRANAMSCAGVKLYREVFDLRHTIEALRAA